jgi:hypothetical protein
VHGSTEVSIQVGSMPVCASVSDAEAAACGAVSRARTDEGDVSGGGVAAQADKTAVNTPERTAGFRMAVDRSPR